MAVSSGITRASDPYPYPNLRTGNDLGSLWADTIANNCGMTCKACLLPGCMWQELHDTRDYIIEQRTGPSQVSSCGCQCCLWYILGGCVPDCPLPELLIFSHKNTFYTKIEGSQYTSGLTSAPVNTNDSIRAATEGAGVYFCTPCYLARERMRAENELVDHQNGRLRLRPKVRPPETANSMR